MIRAQSAKAPARADSKGSQYRARPRGARQEPPISPNPTRNPARPQWLVVTSPTPRGETAERAAACAGTAPHHHPGPAAFAPALRYSSWSPVAEQGLRPGNPLPKEPGLCQTATEPSLAFSARVCLTVHTLSRHAGSQVLPGSPWEATVKSSTVRALISGQRPAMHITSSGSSPPPVNPPRAPFHRSAPNTARLRTLSSQDTQTELTKSLRWPKTNSVRWGLAQVAWMT